MIGGKPPKREGEKEMKATDFVRDSGVEQAVYEGLKDGRLTSENASVMAEWLILGLDVKWGDGTVGITTQQANDIRRYVIEQANR